MAVAIFMQWPGVTADQYDSVMARLDLDASPAAGAVLHLAALTDEGLEVQRIEDHAVVHLAALTDERLEVCDVWQTEQAFHGFLQHRLLPLAHELELEGEPEVQLVPLHNLYAADGDMIDRIGMVSLPAAVAAWTY